MKALWIVVGFAITVALAGCGQRSVLARSLDRQAVFASCAAGAVNAPYPRVRPTLRAALYRLEACMAERRLPGYAAYDLRAHAVRYAYEADQPRLRF